MMGSWVRVPQAAPLSFTRAVIRRRSCGSDGEKIAVLTSSGRTTLAGSTFPLAAPNLTRKPGRTLTVTAILVSVGRSSLPPVLATRPIAKPPPGSGPTGALYVALRRRTDPGPKLTGVAQRDSA